MNSTNDGRTSDQILILVPEVRRLSVSHDRTPPHFLGLQNPRPRRVLLTAVSYLGLVPLVLLASCTTGPSLSIETRTLAPVSPGDSGVHLLFNQRIVADNTVVFLSRAVQPDGSVFYSQREYRIDGTPVATWQEGFWADRWNRFETRYSRNGAEQHINETTNRTPLSAWTLRDPTVLWFWYTDPKVNESVVVTYLAQNQITTSQIRYTYEGDEDLTLAGRTLRAHRVREDPVGTTGVHTVWWYDDQGMGVKRYHKTTEHEYTEELVAWR